MILLDTIFFVSLMSLIIVSILKIINVMEMTENQGIKEITIIWLITVISYIIGFTSFASNIANYFTLPIFNLMTFLFRLCSILWVIEIVLNLIKLQNEKRSDKERYVPNERN